MDEVQLLSLNDYISVQPLQIKEFRENGHTLIKSVVKQQELPAYRQAINEGSYANNTEKRALAERDTYGKAFLQTLNLWEVDEKIKRFTHAKRFAKIAAELLGVENVRLYHDQSLYKEPGGGFTPWHQDQYYWPINTDNTVTMWMPLVDISENMGMLTFASGSHKAGFVGNLAISDESEKLLEEYIKEKGYPISHAASMNAGDATWHNGWTLHNAPGNTSAITREVMTIIFYADGALVTEPKNEHQENDRQRWLMNLKAGELAASDLNPLLL